MAGHYRTGGVYKELLEGFVRVGGVWKEITEGYVKVSGVWKQIHASTVAAFYEGDMTVGNAGTSTGYVDTPAATNIGSLNPTESLITQIICFDNSIFGDEVTVSLDDGNWVGGQPASVDITLNGQTLNLPFLSTGSVGWRFEAEDVTMSTWLRGQNGNTIAVTIVVNQQET